MQDALWKIVAALYQFHKDAYKQSLVFAFGYA
jgi:hypothetical protein